MIKVFLNRKLTINEFVELYTLRKKYRGEQWEESLKILQEGSSAFLQQCIQLNKEINEDLFTGIVSVNVETQLMCRQQD